MFPDEHSLRQCRARSLGHACAWATLALSWPAGMKELFKSIDADGSGTITVGEMRNAMTQWGHKINEAELQVRGSVGWGSPPCLGERRCCMCGLWPWKIGAWSGVDIAVEQGLAPPRPCTCQADTKAMEVDAP